MPAPISEIGGASAYSIADVNRQQLTSRPSASSNLAPPAGPVTLNDPAETGAIGRSGSATRIGATLYQATLASPQSGFQPTQNVVSASAYPATATTDYYGTMGTLPNAMGEQREIVYNDYPPRSSVNYDSEFYVGSDVSPPHDVGTGNYHGELRLGGGGGQSGSRHMLNR